MSSREIRLLIVHREDQEALGFHAVLQIEVGYSTNLLAKITPARKVNLLQKGHVVLL